MRLLIKAGANADYPFVPAGDCDPLMADKIEALQQFRVDVAGRRLWGAIPCCMRLCRIWRKQAV